MEGEKEREREQGEEKESDEAEEKKSDDAEYGEEEDVEGAALVWQEGYGDDDLGLPIMHWEALSLRIAELEKQEELRKEKKAKPLLPSRSPSLRGSCLEGGLRSSSMLDSQSASSLERGRAPVSWTEDREQGRSQEILENGEEDCHIMALSSRLQTQVNLQLCFINNSESEDEEEKQEENCKKRGTVQVPKPPQAPTMPEKNKPSRGFKNALRSLRDKLRTDHKHQSPAHGDLLVKRRRLECSDLQAFSIKELNSLCTSLSQAIQDLSSELVGCLQTRDQLRTEQDAMLLEVQDLTSL